MRFVNLNSYFKCITVVIYMSARLKGVAGSASVMTWAFTPKFGLEWPGHCRFLSLWYYPLMQHHKTVGWRDFWSETFWNLVAFQATFGINFYHCLCKLTQFSLERIWGANMHFWKMESLPFCTSILTWPTSMLQCIMWL